MKDFKSFSFNPSKHLKEEFVSNLSGSSIIELISIILIVPALVVLRHWGSGFCIINDGCMPSRYIHWRVYMLTLSMDFLSFVLPTLTVFTVLADWTYPITVLMTFLFILIFIKRFLSSTSGPGQRNNSSLRSNVSSYRVVVMVVTCLCILAVDFEIFPRRYAKTEAYGTSLMDLGVGSFVVANSLVSRQARNIMSISLKSAMKATAPLLILGIIRILSTTGVDYQVHVGEYGVHWNFFFTLAAVSVLTHLINIHPNYCGTFALLILIAYQICLILGLNEYLLSNSRGSDIISQNKEGLFSIFGYWGMYLSGVYFGYKLLFGSVKTVSVIMARIKVFSLTIFFWLSTVILDKYVERVSRRMCNMAYVSLVLAGNFQVLAIVMLSDLLPGRGTLLLEEAINRNMLGIFLVANLLTGLVNLTVNTLSASSFASFCILLGYAGILSAIAGITCFYGIKMKFW